MQCSILAFKGLFPEHHNWLVMTVLYHCAEWHTLAKLHMHTEVSLSLLKMISQQLGSILWKFRDETAQAYCMLELPREYATWQHYQQASGPSKTSRGQSSTPMPKGLNLNTYKFHAIGDYEYMITQFGTTDSYTTQIMCSIVSLLILHWFILWQGELTHHTIKASYSLMNKNNALKQITKHEVRRWQFWTSSAVKASNGDLLLTCKPELHHSISNTSRNSMDIFSFLQEHEMDSAIKVLPFHHLHLAADHTLVFYPKAKGPFTVLPTQP